MNILKRILIDYIQYIHKKEMETMISEEKANKFIDKTKIFQHMYFEDILIKYNGVKEFNHIDIKTIENYIKESSSIDTKFMTRTICHDGKENELDVECRIVYLMKDEYNDEDVKKCFDHINSYLRKKTDWTIEKVKCGCRTINCFKIYAEKFKEKRSNRVFKETTILKHMYCEEFLLKYKKINDCENFDDINYINLKHYVEKAVHSDYIRMMLFDTQKGVFVVIEYVKEGADDRVKIMKIFKRINEYLTNHTLWRVVDPVINHRVVAN